MNVQELSEIKAGEEDFEGLAKKKNYVREVSGVKEQALAIGHYEWEEM